MRAWWLLGLLFCYVVGTCQSVKPVKPSGLIKAVAFRVIPGQQTTYYQFGQPSSQTNCYGSGSSFGSFDMLHMNCDTTYTNPTEIPFTWQWADVYNVVETDSYRLLIGCRASVRWSKCAPLVPGDVFDAEAKGQTLTVFSYKDGDTKRRVKVKYQVLGTVPLN